MSTDYEWYADFTDLDDKAEELEAGWEAIQRNLAEDEEWAKELFESFQGQEV